MLHILFLHTDRLLSYKSVFKELLHVGPTATYSTFGVGIDAHELFHIPIPLHIPCHQLTNSTSLSFQPLMLEFSS